MTESKIWMFVDIILDKDIATIKSGCNRLGGNIRFPHSHSERKEMFSLDIDGDDVGGGGAVREVCRHCGGMKE